MASEEVSNPMSTEPNPAVLTTKGVPLKSHLKGAEKRVITRAARKKQDEEVRSQAFACEQAEAAHRRSHFRSLPLGTKISRTVGLPLPRRPPAPRRARFLPSA